jgi:hypothetical protein
LTTMDAESLYSCGFSANSRCDSAWLGEADFRRLLPVCCPRFASRERSSIGAVTGGRSQHYHRAHGSPNPPRSRRRALRLPTLLGDDGHEPLRDRRLRRGDGHGRQRRTHRSRCRQS